MYVVLLYMYICIYNYVCVCRLYWPLGITWTLAITEWEGQLGLESVTLPRCTIHTLMHTLTHSHIRSHITHRTHLHTHILTHHTCTHTFFTLSIPSWRIFVPLTINPPWFILWLALLRGSFLTVLSFQMI